MNPLIVSARFAAYVWYTKHFACSPPRQAAAFAKMNWPTFMPLAQDGLGRLLKKIAAKKRTALEKNTPVQAKRAEAENAFGGFAARKLAAGEVAKRQINRT